MARLRIPRGRVIAPRDLVLTEKVKSREITEVSGRRTIDFEYDLLGTSSEQMAHNFLLLNTPRVYEGLFRMEAKAIPIQVDEGKDTGHWLCSVRYATGDVVPRELTDSSSTFDTTGGTTHITQSQATVAAVAADGGRAGNHQKAIRVEGDRVVGHDIPSPLYNFTESRIFPSVEVTPFFKGVLFTLRGRMNDGSFMGFARGECLFLGAIGARRGIGDWEVVYRFAASPNTINIPIGDNIIITSKLGWDLLWVEYQYSTDPQAHRLVMIPKAAYVERVLDFGNFAVLRIGT